MRDVPLVRVNVYRRWEAPDTSLEWTARGRRATRSGSHAATRLRRSAAKLLKRVRTWQTVLRAYR